LPSGSSFWQHRSVSGFTRQRLSARVNRAEDEGVAELVVRTERGDAGAEHAAGVDERTPDLVRRAQAGEVEAREQLVENLLPLVSALARRYRTEGLEHTDLIQDGVVGLLRALERFEPERGVPFAAFATWWIRHALQDARSDFVRPFRIPPKALRQLSQLKSEHQRVYEADHRSASVAELAERTNIDIDQAEALVAADARVLSLDEVVVGDEGELGSLSELLEDPLSAAAYEEIVDSIAGEQLRALLSRLTEREREVIDARFGFAVDPETLVGIGERLGVSAERVRQIEERALAKLRLTR
jgi:RNA polymerase sigma factor (sigma-70 family)